MRLNTRSHEVLHKSGLDSRAVSRQRSSMLMVVSANAVYLLAFVVIYPAAGAGATALSAIPAALAGWLLGWRAGLLAGMLQALLDTALLNTALEPGWTGQLRDSGVLGTLAPLLIGGAAGWLRQLLGQARDQANELAHLRAELHAFTSGQASHQHSYVDGEARFRSLIQDLHVGVLLQGPHAEILFSNRAALDLLGLTEDQLLGKTSFDPDWHVIHIDGSPFPGETHPVPMAIATRQPVRDVVMGVYRPSRHDRVWLHVDAQPQLAADGNVCQVICTFSDITKRLETKLALRESEHRHRSVMDSIAEVVFQTDASGHWTFLNAAWTEITGYAVDDSIGRSCFDCVHPDDQPGQRAALQQLICHQQQYCEQEVRFVTSRGDTCWVELFARPSYDSNGVLSGISGTIADITARKQAEHQRLLIERKMFETQKLESLGVLAGGIAHDFNNLLMAIIGNADIAMLDLPATDPVRDSIVQIQLAAKRAAELTGQMLAYAGKGHRLIECFDLNLLVEEITVLLMVSIPKTTLLRYNLSANLPLIEGDAAQVRQVVMNLVINAAEAVGDREGLITISTGVRYVDRTYFQTARLASNLPAGYYIYLEVNDTGVGMDAATLAKIFDPFFSTKFAGRGLGLAAVSGIVRGHDGAIQVQSRPAQGTIFTVLLPAVKMGSAVPGQPTEVLLAPLLPVKPGDRTTVLVADDESSVRTITASLLERYGFQVLTAGDGRSALDLYSAHTDQIDLVLLDLTMPQMSGEETLHALRAIRPSLPVLIMSGYDERELTRSFAGLEPIGFLQKPFLAQALYACVEQAFAGTLPAR